MSNDPGSVKIPASRVGLHAQTCDFQFNVKACIRVIFGFLLSVELMGTAGATDFGPGSRLMLAAIIAEHSPLLSASDRIAVARLAAGHLASDSHDNGTITVTADDLDCRASNVDITFRTCDIRFRSKTVTLHGRGAHELFATIAEMGVAPDGAAGSSFIGISHVNCRLDIRDLRQKGGGGAACGFGPSAR